MFKAKVNWDEVLQDYLANNLSNADIAEKYDLDPGYVYQRIRKAKETGELRRIKNAMNAAVENANTPIAPVEENEGDLCIAEDPPVAVDEKIDPAPQEVPPSPQVTSKPNDPVITRLSALGISPERAAEIRQLIGSPKDVAIQRQLKAEVVRKTANCKAKHGKVTPGFLIEMKRYQNLDRFRRLGIKANEIRILAGIRL